MVIKGIIHDISMSAISRLTMKNVPHFKERRQKTSCLNPKGQISTVIAALILTLPSTSRMMQAATMTSRTSSTWLKLTYPRLFQTARKPLSGGYWRQSEKEDPGLG